MHSCCTSDGCSKPPVSKIEVAPTQAHGKIREVFFRIKRTVDHCTKELRLQEEVTETRGVDSRIGAAPKNAECRSRNISLEHVA